MATDMSEADRDDQDQSEVFDEDNQELDDAGSPRAETKTLEEIPDVLDVTSAVGDADDDAGRIAEDMDEAEIEDLETDAALADFEDDELAARMPEGLYDAAAGGRGPGRADAAEVELLDGGDLERVTEDAAGAAADLEAQDLADDDIADLGYSDTGSRDGRAGSPVRLDIVLRKGLWALSRDGQHLHDYGHAAQAVNEASAMARELRASGEPAVLFLEAADGKVVEVTEDPPPAPPEEEASAVHPDRSRSA
jgi:hypothetical protein